MANNTLNIAESNNSSAPMLPAPVAVDTTAHVQPHVDDSHQQTATAAPVQPQAIAPSNHGMNADDLDLIEKVWVQKAKAIVNATLNDPREQARLLGEMKTEYMQKRFGKEIGKGK